MGKIRRNGFSQRDVDRQWNQIVNMIRKKQISGVVVANIAATSSMRSPLSLRISRITGPILYPSYFIVVPSNVQMVESMRDQAIPNGVIINDAYCDRSMTRDYDREALNAFFATLKEEDFEVVVVRSLNEITDDIYDLEEFVNTITDMGIWLYSLEVGPVPITVSHAEDFGC